MACYALGNGPEQPVEDVQYVPDPDHLLDDDPSFPYCELTWHKELLILKFLPS